MPIKTQIKSNSKQTSPDAQENGITMDAGKRSILSAKHKSESPNDRIGKPLPDATNVDQSGSASPIAEAEIPSIDSDPILSLPPLDDAAVGGIEQHQIPTFNEFHAMLSENDDTKALKGGGNGDHGRIPSGAEERPNTLPSPKNPANTVPTLESGTPGSSHTGNSADHDAGNKPISDLPATNGRDGAMRHGPDVSVATEPNVEPVVSQTDRLDEAKLLTDPATESSQSSEHIHPRESQSQSQHQQQHNQSPSDRSVTLRRNVASVACGSKLLDSSQAIKNAEAVLNSNNDEYMNVPCSADKWFVIEVCEPVQLRMIELANYELFSSRVKSFKVFVSDRYPAKSWDLVGQFAARDIKGIQNFQVSGDKLIKFVKFELLEHYGSEHYCPLTMIRLFGLVSDDFDDDDDDEVEVRVAAAAAASRTGASGLDMVIPTTATDASTKHDVGERAQHITATEAEGEPDPVLLNNAPLDSTHWC
ncbi:unnamed protein product [Echinostoma caproni]|uniref:SUN domain-containing protein n=1 Tax=Echinostoma caproni TaxID=27848 RepID=A0A3P8LCN0_9TREM|nr:unnamed protein product [Echinostoma caproni]